MPIQDAVMRLQPFRIFDGLDAADLDMVGSLVEDRRAVSPDVLVRQGDVPGAAYLIERGTVAEFTRDASGTEVLLRRAETQDIIGGRALIDSAPSPIEARVEQTAQLLVLSAANLKTLLAMFPVLRDRLRRTGVVSRLLTIPLFGSCSRAELHQVAELAQEIGCIPGQQVFGQHDVADALYVIDTGQVKEAFAVSRAGQSLLPRYMAAGSVFGYDGLSRRANRRSSAEAVTEAHLFRFNTDAFRWLSRLKPGFQQALRGPDVVGYLQQGPLFSKLDAIELNHLAGYVGLLHICAGDALYRQGEDDPTLYILYAGEAVLRHRDAEGKERPGGYVKVGKAIGESSLLLQEPRDVTLEATTPTDWLYLTRRDLEQFLAQHPNARRKLQATAPVQGRQALKRFSWMDADEQPVLYTRRHWFFLTERLLLPAGLLLAAAVAQWLGYLRVLGFLGRVPHFLSILLLIAAGLLLVWRVLDWTNDYYLLTTKRVVHREKVILVRERLDETPLDKIQNVNIYRGFWANQFGFGDLLIDTAASTATGVVRVAFAYVGKPEEVQALILAQMSRVRAREHVESRQEIRQKLAQALGESVRPVVPRPAVPMAAVAPTTKPGPGIGRRIYELSWWNWFWIERETEDRITWRKHWIRLIARIWLPSLLLPGLVVVALVGAIFLPLAVPLWMAVLGVAGWWWYAWTDWGNDLYSVTNDRIIDSEKKPLGFRTTSTETMFDRVQNVSFEIPHPIATLLNYGTVYIYTAGAQGKLSFSWVRNPQKVQAEIFRRLTAYQAAQRQKDRDEQQASLPQWFAAYDEARR